LQPLQGVQLWQDWTRSKGKRRVLEQAGKRVGERVGEQAGESIGERVGAKWAIDNWAKIKSIARGT
jgi:hypothetical protein